MKISLGSDHAGYELKEQLKVWLINRGVAVEDKGAYSDQRVDYPDFAHAVADSVVSGESDYGLLFCGSANGVAMSANKHAHVRCAVCWNKEIARLARAHNDANIAALPARFVSEEEAIDMVDVFLSEAFEGGRHQDRVEKIGLQRSC